MNRPILALLLRSAALSGLLGGFAQASITLSFSRAFEVATNWLDPAGSSNTLMLWGVVVDTNGDGFSQSGYLPGFVYGFGGVLVAPQRLAATDGSSDDILFVAPIKMVAQTTAQDGANPGINKITTITQIPYATVGFPGLNPGDAFAIIWFDQTTFGNSAVAGDRFGFFENPEFQIPPDGSTYQLSPVFAGVDAPKPMTYEVVPEPSGIWLASLSLFVINRRRR